MNDNLPTYQQRRDDAVQRLVDALEPQDRGEVDVIGWLASTLSTPGSLDVLVAMMERAVRHATATGYERGWHEGRVEQ